MSDTKGQSENREEESSKHVVQWHESLRMIFEDFFQVILALAFFYFLIVIITGKWIP